MIVVDASIVIALGQRADPHHESAYALLDSDERFLIHPVTLAETLVGAARKGVAEQVRTTLTRDLGIEVYRPGDDEPLRVAHLRANTGLKLPDCYVLSTAREATADLATFDLRLARAAADVGVRIAGALL